MERNEEGKIKEHMTQKSKVDGEIERPTRKTIRGHRKREKKHRRAMERLTDKRTKHKYQHRQRNRNK